MITAIINILHLHVTAKSAYILRYCLFLVAIGRAIGEMHAWVVRKLAACNRYCMCNTSTSDPLPINVYCTITN